jgi:hypothetical protein
MLAKSLILAHNILSDMETDDSLVSARGSTSKHKEICVYL